MHRFIFILVALLLPLGLGACDDNFVDVNTNPNEPESVEPSLLLPSVLRQVGTLHAVDSFRKGNILSQHAAKTLRVEFDIYDVGPSPLTWSTLYEALRDVRNIRVISQESGDTTFEGVALVLEAWIFSILTDAYGDIPYSEALKAREGVNFPAYDDQEQIYMGSDGLLARLEQANGLLTGGSVAGDILFGGDVRMWRKFANSLRLRLLMRVSEQVGVAADVQAMVASPASFPLFDATDENAVLNFLNSGQNVWPLLPFKVGDFDAVMASETLVDRLSALNDPRLDVYARPTDPTLGSDSPIFVGLPNGLAEDNTPSFNLSRLGFRYYDYPGHPVADEKANAVFMTHAEVEFLLAEAAQRGMISGDAASFYNQGVRSSMAYYGADFSSDDAVASVEDYLAQPEVAFDGTLQRIAEQKWIALYFNGFEAWFDFRRQGLPTFIEPGPDVVAPFPLRFQYPGEEESLNPENYQAAVQRMGGNRTDVPVWWDTD